ncbi:MAG: hypothetical protein KAS93_00980 [Gammaproteobacteria bacterium]|nr:hypothetical protein [Gammaproteobacteria bacterium]
MSEAHLTNLKLKIEHLMHNRSQLARENRALRNKLARAIQERASLSHQKETISKKLRNYISQIKEELS